MAIELGKVNTADLTENSYKVLGIGINKRSDSNGVFAVNYTTIQQAKDNLINLIMTRKGERVMQPDFGCDIWRVLFEPIDGGRLENRIEDYIEEAVNRWLPNILIQNIEFPYDETDIDNNNINVSIKFSLNANPLITETLEIKI